MITGMSALLACSKCVGPHSCPKVSCLCQHEKNNNQELKFSAPNQIAQTKFSQWQNVSSLTPSFHFAAFYAFLTFLFYSLRSFYTHVASLLSLLPCFLFSSSPHPFATILLPSSSCSISFSSRRCCPLSLFRLLFFGSSQRVCPRPCLFYFV